MSFSRLAVIIMVLFYLAYPNLYAQIDSTISGSYPATSATLSISSFNLTGTLYPGDTASLAINYTGIVNGNGQIRIDFPKYLVPLDQQPGEKYRLITVPVTSGQISQIQLPVKVIRDGGSHISVSTTLLDAPSDFRNKSVRYANVESTAGSYRVIYDNQMYSKVISPVDSLPIAGPAPIVQHFILQGRVHYQHPEWMQDVNLKGTRVHFVFLSKNGIQAMHPTEGLHSSYDICDQNGNFFFDFVAFKEITYLKENFDVAILVEKGNEAASIQGGGGHYIISNSVGTFITYGQSEGIRLPIVPIGLGTSFTFIYDNLDIQINPMDGLIYTAATISREMVLARYDGNLPFDLPPAQIVRQPQVYSNGKEFAGIFRSWKQWATGSESNVILISEKRGIRHFVVCHEYGHYVGYQMWGAEAGKVSQASSTMKEGWAIFFSFAARCYGMNRYGHNYGFVDNTEYGSFTSPKYVNFSYGLEHPEYCRLACYLWNIYDSNNDSYFMPNGYVYNGRNNDDVNGLGKRTFEIFRSFHSNTSSISEIEYHNRFKDGLSSDYQSSIQDIYNMNVLETGVMRPAQLKNVEYAVHEKSIDFTWESNSYISSLECGNYESGYRIYKRITGTDAWLLVATAPYGTNYASVTGGYGQFRLTAYNSAGESLNPQYVATAKLSANFETRHETAVSTVIPNPAIDAADVKYSLSEAAVVNMSIHDVTGATLFTVIQSRYHEPGDYTHKLNCSLLSAGTYFIRISMTSQAGHRNQKVVTFVVQ